MCFDAVDQGSHQRGSGYEDAEGCHTDQQGVAAESHEAEMLEVLSARTDPVTSPTCYTGTPRQPNQLDTRTPQLSVILSCPTSNTESVEVGEDASELSCLREQPTKREM